MWLYVNTSYLSKNKLKFEKFFIEPKICPKKVGIKNYTHVEPLNGGIIKFTEYFILINSTRANL